MFRFAVVCLVGLCAAAPGSAASWADAMFEELSKDFGSVPRGPTLTHLFRVTNNTGVPVHIAGLRVSCGCVSASAQVADLAPGQATVVQAQMDTRRFQGVKNVTIYVQFDRPAWEEVRLWVQANSRDDINVAPEAMAFGSVKRGSTPSVTVTVSLFGSGQWQIDEIQRESNYVDVSAQEVRRTETEATYQVTAKLRADTPVGRWFTDVWLKTNHPAMPRVRVPLTVDVESALSVSPSTVVLGQVKPGTETERRVIVRGVKPFRIREVKGTDAQLTVRDSTPDSKPVHVLTVKLKATDPGDLARTLRIVTDLPEEGEIEFQARAQVVATTPPTTGE